MKRSLVFALIAAATVCACDDDGGSQAEGGAGGEPAAGGAPAGGADAGTGGGLAGGSEPVGGSAPIGGGEPVGGNAPVGGSEPVGGNAPIGGSAPIGGGEPVGGSAPPLDTAPNVEVVECTRSAEDLAAEVGEPHAYDERVQGNVRTITANAIPNHAVGAFPNPGNPNVISPQSIAYTVPVTPAGAGAGTTVFGVALSGAVFDPGTAETWNDDPTWRYEALRYGTAPPYFASNGGTDDTFHPGSLGVDCNYAHVQPTGAYHYHGIPTGLMPSEPASTQIGWAADGHPIFGRWGHQVANDVSTPLVELRASWRLKSGERPGGDAGPGGTYDGTFGNDWEYVEGSGDLDACNGRTGVVTLGGEQVETYHYVITTTFPYIPRCTSAAPDASFARGMMGGGMMGGGMMGQVPACAPGQTERCCGDGTCDGPETAMNCNADC